MAEKCKELTTFIFRYRMYKFEVIPFGSMNAPSTFQKMTEIAFPGLPFVLFYLDAVVLFPKI